MAINCDICKEEFSTKSSLTRHLLNKHNVSSETKKKVLTKCISCMDKTFSKKKLLIEHLNTQHGMCIKEEIMHFSSVSGNTMTYYNVYLFIKCTKKYPKLNSRVSKLVKKL